MIMAVRKKRLVEGSANLTMRILDSKAFRTGKCCIKIACGANNMGVMIQMRIRPPAKRAICPMTGDNNVRKDISINAGKMITSRNIIQIMVRYKSCKVCHPMIPGVVGAASVEITWQMEFM
jgi:hypothetical protein